MSDTGYAPCKPKPTFRYFAGWYVVHVISMGMLLGFTLRALTWKSSLASFVAFGLICLLFIVGIVLAFCSKRKIDKLCSSDVRKLRCTVDLEPVLYEACITVTPELDEDDTERSDPDS